MHCCTECNNTDISHKMNHGISVMYCRKCGREFYRKNQVEQLPKKIQKQLKFVVAWDYGGHTCEHCNGMGRDWDGEPCFYCESGVITETMREYYYMYEGGEEQTK